MLACDVYYYILYYMVLAIKSQFMFDHLVKRVVMKCSSETKLEVWKWSKVSSIMNLKWNFDIKTVEEESQSYKLNLLLMFLLEVDI